MQTPIPDVPQRDERLRICHMLLSTLKAINAAMFGAQSNFGLELETIVVACAVLIGHAEARAMTANKIALYLGMPRSTVLRKLRRLQQIGIVFSINGRYYVTAEHLASDRALVEKIGAIIADAT